MEGEWREEKREEEKNGEGDANVSKFVIIYLFKIRIKTKNLSRPGAPVEFPWLMVIPVERARHFLVRMSAE